MALFQKYPKVQAFFGITPDRVNPFEGQDYQEQSDLMVAMHNRAWQPLFNVSYDGEKDQGAMGPIKRYWLDYSALRTRSWQAYLDSELAQGILRKYTKWIIGTGLKLQSEPESSVLDMEGITINKEQFSKDVEARFKIFTKSTKVDHSGRKNLNQIAKSAYKNAIVGGDVLVILRLVGEQITIQLVDGSQIQQPIMTSEHHRIAKENGNRIRHGVEIGKNGEHVAYFVREQFNKFTRIESKSEGRLTAFLVVGLEYRLDGTRGIPLISAVMQKIKLVDRYAEATVGSAEERQKIVYTIEHGVTSTGESPLATALKAAHNADAPKQTGDIDGEAVANRVATSTSKQVFNMPNDSKLTSLDPKNELYFKDFFTTNANSIASTINIPPEVAFSKYDSNFSASRAALKDWEHTIIVERADFSAQFYQPIYNFWLEVQVLLGKVRATGYLSSIANENDTVIESYQNARFVGANVPHIDPVKEVEAERLKLGDGAKHVPLTTAEASTEALNNGDYDTNLEQVIGEVVAAEELKPEIPVPVTSSEE